MHRDSVIVFTDGSSRGNPGPGGWGAIVVKHDDSRNNVERTQNDAEVVELGGREEHTTNNRMELVAAIKALKFASSLNAKRLTLYADSSYLVNGITKWVYSWERRNWVTMDKKPVLNKDLWEKLLELSRGKQIEWKLVGGHVGVAGNMRCDEIATAFADLPVQTSGGSLRGFEPVKLYTGPLSKYPIKNILDINEDSLLAEKKESGRAHSNAKAYSYVSLVDRVIQTHKTWAECETRVKGKKAKYKKVLSTEEEKSLIEEWSRH